MREFTRGIVRPMVAVDARRSAVIAGAGLGALTTLIVGLGGLQAAAWLVFIGGAWLATVFRRRISLGALCLTLLACYLAVGAPLADPAPTLGDFGIVPNRNLPLLAFMGGCILTGVGYGIGRLSREVGRRLSPSKSQPNQEQRLPEVAQPATEPLADSLGRLSSGISWLAIPVLVGTVVLTQPVPAAQSFGFQLGSEWHVRSTGDSFYQDCSAYWATLESAPQGAFNSELGQASLCVEVYETDNDFGNGGPAEACLGSHAADTYHVPWRTCAVTVAKPAIAGSVEEIVDTADIGRLYGIAVGRQRWVGPIPENLCYWITVQVPPGSSATESTVRSALATFRYR